MLFILLFPQILTAYPVLVFHGMGDFCANPGIHNIMKHIGEQSGNPTHCIESGPSVMSIALQSFEKQNQTACEKVKKDFANQDIAVVGLSQGGLIARYIVEECDFGGTVRRFVSLGGPHMGVTKLPHCGNGFFCKIPNKIVGDLVYYSWAQALVGPAGYYRDVNHLDEYYKKNTFLARLNNELETNEKHKEQMLKLEKMVLVMFSKDTMIIPKESAWFESYFEKTDTIEDLQYTQPYYHDRLGLKTLNESGRLYFEEINGDHLQFSYEDIDRVIIPALQ